MRWKLPVDCTAGMTHDVLTGTSPEGSPKPPSRWGLRRGLGRPGDCPPGVSCGLLGQPMEGFVLFLLHAVPERDANRGPRWRVQRADAARTRPEAADGTPGTAGREATFFAGITEFAGVEAPSTPVYGAARTSPEQRAGLRRRRHVPATSTGAGRTSWIAQPAAAGAAGTPTGMPGAPAWIGCLDRTGGRQRGSHPDAGAARGMIETAGARAVSDLESGTAPWAER